MDALISQTNTICSSCSKRIYQGDRAWYDKVTDYMICEECYNDTERDVNDQDDDTLESETEDW